MKEKQYDKNNSPRKGVLLLLWSHKCKITALKKCTWKHYAKGKKGVPNRIKAKLKEMHQFWLALRVIVVVRKREKIKNENPPAQVPYSMHSICVYFSQSQKSISFVIGTITAFFLLYSLRFFLSVTFKKKFYFYLSVILEV